MIRNGSYKQQFNWISILFDLHKITSLQIAIYSSRKKLDEATYIQTQGPLYDLIPGTAKTFTKSTMNSLTIVLAYSKCYPYIKTNVLIEKTSNVWEAFCEKNVAIKKQLRRRIMAMKADPKADPFILSKTETASAEWVDACTLSHIGLYRMRVLNTLHQKSNN